MKQPYVIAEMGVNYYDTAKALKITPLEAAKLYIDEAAKVGIDCAKFQSYKAETLAAKDSPAYWDRTKEGAKTQYELFQKYDKFGEKEYGELSDYAHALGMDFTSTPFDEEAVSYLEGMVDFYKISSSDLNNLPFIRKIAAKGKRLMLSVGASYLSEVEEAVRVVEESGCKDLTLLHCVLSYPTKIEDANLLNIKTLQNVFPEVQIGYSDHVPPDETMMTVTGAYMLGAEVIEKHFTLDRSLPGNDHYHAADPAQFSLFIQNCERLQRLLGHSKKTVLPCEEMSRKQARRSLVLTKNIEKGEIIENRDIIVKRPGIGIPPKDLELVIGRAAKRDLKKDSILCWDMI